MTANGHLRPAGADAPAEPIYIFPGRSAISLDGVALTTIVGSGLALCLWDPVRSIGGTAHYLLPEAGERRPRRATATWPCASSWSSSRARGRACR